MAPSLPEAFDLSGRTALVTGAGSPTGIGMACARLLAQCGARVVVAATTGRVHERVAELADAGHVAAGVVADLTTGEGAAAVVAAAVDLGGGLDVLVNNAGMVATSAGGDYLEGDLLGTPPERWAASLARNLDTAYLTTRAALPLLRASGHGRVVMVTSVTGAAMAMRGEVGYAAAKAALVGLTRALAVDEARHGLTVNAVAPGWVSTGSQTPAEAREGLVTPVGRSGTAQEVAAAVAFLAGPGAALRQRPGARGRRRQHGGRGAPPRLRRCRARHRDRASGCAIRGQGVGRCAGSRRAHAVSTRARLPVGGYGLRRAASRMPSLVTSQPEWVEFDAVVEALPGAGTSRPSFGAEALAAAAKARTRRVEGTIDGVQVNVGVNRAASYLTPSCTSARRCNDGSARPGDRPLSPAPRRPRRGAARR